MKLSLNLQNYNKNTSFKALHTYNVTRPKSRALVDAEMDKLEELGKKYEINLYDDYDVINDKEFLIACVEKSGKTLPANYRNGYGLYNPFGRKQVCTDDCKSVVNLVYSAIATLRH